MPYIRKFIKDQPLKRKYFTRKLRTVNAMLQLSNIPRTSFYKAPLSTFKQKYWVNMEIKLKKAFCSVTFTRTTVGSCTVVLGQDCTQKLKTFDFLKLFHTNDYHAWTDYVEWLGYLVIVVNYYLKNRIELVYKTFTYLRLGQTRRDVLTFRSLAIEPITFPFQAWGILLDC